MTAETLRERIGVDVGTRLAIEDAIEWAGEHDVRYVDVRLDDRLEGGFDDEEAAAIRDACDANDVELGLHTLSAVNVAETAPIVRGAVGEYLDAYVDAAARLDARHVVVHGGYHFTGDAEERIEAGIARLDRALDRARERDVRLLLENHNPEPERAEVHYVPTSPAEFERFFEALDPDWAFNPPHANLDPAGIEGFADAFPLERCGEVRLNDNRGTHEEHLPPGEGEIDFAALFDRLEGVYDGPYVLAYGDLEEMLDGREYLLEVVG